MWIGNDLDTGAVAFDVAAVPEPATWSLMLGGALAIGDGLVAPRR